MAECMSRGGVFSSLKSIQYSNRHPMKWIYGLWHIRVLTIVDWKIHPSSWTHCSCRSLLFRKVCVFVRAGLMPHLFLGAVLFSFICFTWAFIFISAFVLMCAQCMLRCFSPTGHMYGPVTLWIRLAWSPWPTGPWMITLFCEGHDFYQ